MYLSLVFFSRRAYFVCLVFLDVITTTITATTIYYICIVLENATYVLFIPYLVEQKSLVLFIQSCPLISCTTLLREFVYFIA